MSGGNFSPPPPSADHVGHKANFDANEQNLHTRGVPSLWSEISSLLIIVGIIAVIYVVFRIF